MSTGGAASKTAAVHKVNVDFGAQNDEHAITHAQDNESARKVTILDSNDLEVQWDTTKFEITHTSPTVTTIKMINATPQADVTLIVAVPVS